MLEREVEADAVPDCVRLLLALLPGPARELEASPEQRTCDAPESGCGRPGDRKRCREDEDQREGAGRGERSMSRVLEVPKCSLRCSMKRDEVVERTLLSEDAKDGAGAAAGLKDRARTSSCCLREVPVEVAMEGGETSTRSLNGPAASVAA